MSSNQLNVLVSLMIAIAFLVSESTNTELKRYCGKTLSDTLRDLCGGVYNTPIPNDGYIPPDGPYYSPDDSPDDSPDNSSDNSPDNSLNLDPDRDQEMEEDYSFDCELLLQVSVEELNKRFPGRRFRRISKKKGIYEECCLNMCTLNDLSMYCA